ncbi:MAG: guanidinobutyrase [Mycobacterium sp.]|jgi:agmatinase|nr:guanidinobutyrase [Mycobacterium sp.]
MAFTGFGPDITFLGVPRCDLDDVSTYADADIVILGAPLDGGTTYRSGTRFGPSALRQACYLPQDGSRPSLALRVDGLKDLRVYDAGDVEFYNGNIERAVELIEADVFKISSAGAIPIILGGDHTIAWPDHTGVARQHGFGNVSMIHFDAHADTGDIHLGSLVGHGTPMRRLIESGALRGDRFLQLGLRGYWPDEPVLQWMAAHGLRSYEMTEIVARGLETCLTEAFQIATSDCEGVFLSVDIDVCDPGHAPGTGTPEPGGFTARELLDAVRRICYELPVLGIDVVEVSPPYDHADITALLGNRVVLEAISAIARRRKDKAQGTVWDPRQPLLEGREVDEQLRLIAEGEEARRRGEGTPRPHQH